MVLNGRREKVITVENIDSIHQVSFLQSYYIEDFSLFLADTCLSISYAFFQLSCAMAYWI